MTRGRAIFLAATFVLLSAGAEPVLAHESAGALQERIGFDQNIGARLPLDAYFRDEAGRDVRLGELLAGKPAVLELAWYSCDQLCPITLRNLAAALGRVPFAPGRDFSVLTVSIDPREGPKESADARRQMLAAYGRGQVDGWHALTGDAAAIEALARAIGFRYAYDADHDQYVHPAGVVVVDGASRVAHYLFGLEFAARDLRYALVDAGRGVLGSPIDRLALRCHSVDPATGQYTFAVMTVVDVAAGATALGLAGFIGIWLRRESRERRRRGTA